MSDYAFSDEKNFDKVESNKYKVQQRKFWDGGLMNNTPLMSAIYRHRDYWYYTRGVTNNIPSLGMSYCKSASICTRGDPH